VVCVFDPADTTLGAKVPLFAALWAATLLMMLTSGDRSVLPVKATIYVAAFVAVPALSLLRYDLVNGYLPPHGLNLFKGYLLISLTIVLVVSRVDLVPQLSAALAVLACLVIAVFVAIELDYARMYNLLQPLGLRAGLLYLDERSYGNIQFLQVFFATSPMLVIAIAYYFDRAMSEPATRRKLLFFAVAAISAAGMFLAGTRANMLVSLLLPFLLCPFYAARPGLSALYSLGGLTILALVFAGHMTAFFDPAEFGNNIKLVTVNDYIELLRDPANLLLGQGLGASYDWSTTGRFFTTELTYLELIRNFGLFGALIILALLTLPLVSAILSPTSRRDRALAVAWFLYLVMSASNPILFSSMGTLILAGLTANIFPLPDYIRPR
jgi:hypothetical protein